MKKRAFYRTAASIVAAAAMSMTICGTVLAAEPASKVSVLTYFNQGADELDDVLYSDKDAGAPQADDSVYVKRADDKVISYVKEDAAECMGAHPDTIYRGYTMDTKTGSQLTLKDVVDDYDGLQRAVVDALKAQESESGGFNADYESTVKTMFSKDEVQWFMGDDDLCILFNEDTVAPHAAGPIVVQISYGTGLLNESYR